MATKATLRWPCAQRKRECPLAALTSTSRLDLRCAQARAPLQSSRARTARSIAGPVADRQAIRNATRSNGAGGHYGVTELPRVRTHPKQTYYAHIEFCRS